MLKHKKWLSRKALPRSGKGFTLLEVVIAVAVLALIAAAIPATMVVVSDARFRQNELRIAENLSRAQFEYIKAQDYNPAPFLGGFPYGKLDTPTNYEIWLDVQPINPESGESCPGGCDGEEDLGVQRITIRVFGYRLDPKDPENYILETTDYKVDNSFEGQTIEITGYEVSH